MSKWSVEFQLEARHDLSRMTFSVQNRIINKLDWLEDNFDDIYHIALKGEFKDFYKLRVGDWRLIYKTDWGRHTIIICYIDRRDKVYKRGKN